MKYLDMKFKKFNTEKREIEDLPIAFLLIDIFFQANILWLIRSVPVAAHLFFQYSVFLTILLCQFNSLFIISLRDYKNINQYKVSDL